MRARNRSVFATLLLVEIKHFAIRTVSVFTTQRRFLDLIQINTNYYYLCLILMTHKINQLANLPHGGDFSCTLFAEVNVINLYAIHFFNPISLLSFTHKLCDLHAPKIQIQSNQGPSKRLENGTTRVRFWLGTLP